MWCGICAFIWLFAKHTVVLRCAAEYRAGSTARSRYAEDAAESLTHKRFDGEEVLHSGSFASLVVVQAHVGTLAG